MYRCLSALGITLLLLLFSAQGWALSGPETAMQLNQRMAATPSQCVGGKPPHSCSGVLMLFLPEDHPQPFWHHDDEAQVRGSERFLFVRQDRPPSMITVPRVGYILQDRFSAVSQGKPYEVVADSGDEVMVRNWDENAPQALAVQALYYDSADAVSLLRAQRGQREWFEATGVWLPLLRFHQGEGRGAFGFSQQEQLYNGYQVAARLNARYADDEDCADGHAGYYCNGVIVRTVGAGNFHAWNPSPNSDRINGVSFSYFRRDLKADTMVYPRGYVIRELSAPAVTPFEPACFYPTDGATDNAADGGICTVRNTCQALGIHDLAAWLARYQSAPRNGCSLSLSEADLKLAREIRHQPLTLDPWTELVIRPWKQNIGKELPIEAIVYSLESYYEADGPGGGRHTQRDYLEQTGRYLPLLKADFTSAQGTPFSFDPADQSMP
ncbi:MAG TPA: hypothetical protein DIT18_13790 [Pseudomonas sp.]|nr:hypothetical protein [Pseudomonas sp.]